MTKYDVICYEEVDKDPDLGVYIRSMYRVLNNYPLPDGWTYAWLIEMLEKEGLIADNLKGELYVDEFSSYYIDVCDKRTYLPVFGLLRKDPGEEHFEIPYNSAQDLRRLY